MHIICKKRHVFLIPDSPSTVTNAIYAMFLRFSMLTKENFAEEYLSPLTAKNFTSFMAYNDAKLCSVIVASEINRRWAVHGVTCNSVHPGNMVSTGLSRHSFLYKAMFSAVRPFTKSLVTSAYSLIPTPLKCLTYSYFVRFWQCSNRRLPPLFGVLPPMNLTVLEVYI